MKKPISCVILIVLTLSLSGCGIKNTHSSKKNSKTISSQLVVPAKTRKQTNEEIDYTIEDLNGAWYSTEIDCTLTIAQQDSAFLITFSDEREDVTTSEFYSVYPSAFRFPLPDGHVEYNFSFLDVDTIEFFSGYKNPEQTGTGITKPIEFKRTS